MVDLSIQPWSAVWRIPTRGGAVVLKQTRDPQPYEGAVQAACAEAAPGFVDPPLVHAAGRLLLSDGGPSLHDAGTASLDVVVDLVTDYAHLQRVTVGRHRELQAAGLPRWDPADAGVEVERQLDRLHALPASDPRAITAAQRDQLRCGADAFAESGRALAASAIPSCLEHGDLWPGNVHPPLADGHYRFFDFGDAVWSHPFLSVLSLLYECHRRWALPTPIRPFDVDHPALQRIIDSYLRSWTDYGSLTDLREMLALAIRVAPLRRSRAVLDNLVRATAADADDLGPTPLSWLETAVPVME